MKGTKTNCCNGWVENEIGYEVVALIDQTVFILFFSFSIFSPVLERVFLVLLTTSTEGGYKHKANELEKRINVVFLHK